jgi:hypothetical protein
MKRFLLVSAICGLLAGCQTENSPPRFHSVIRMDRKAAEKDAKARQERAREWAKNNPMATNVMAGGYSGYGTGLGTTVPGASTTTTGSAVGGGGVVGTGGLSTGVGTSAGTVGVGTTTPGTSVGSTIGGSSTTATLPGSVSGAGSVGTGVSGVGTGLGGTTSGTGVGSIGTTSGVSPSPNVSPSTTGLATNTGRIFTNGVSPQP